ncbi:hypothetical protein D8Z77_17800 [Brevibacillus laterosporus]|nr:hypothetical protein D8Z77_17800 [Brevibacillus laterosporus]
MGTATFLTSCQSLCILLDNKLQLGLPSNGKNFVFTLKTYVLRSWIVTACPTSNADILIMENTFIYVEKEH